MIFINTYFFSLDFVLLKSNHVIIIFFCLELCCSIIVLFVSLFVFLYLSFSIHIERSIAARMFRSNLIPMIIKFYLFSQVCHIDNQTNLKLRPNKHFLRFFFGDSEYANNRDDQTRRFLYKFQVCLNKLGFSGKL